MGGSGYWNYRVVRKNGLLGIHEAYYDEAGTVHSLTINPVSPTYEDLTALKTHLELMLSALDENIIDFEDIV